MHRQPLFAKLKKHQANDANESEALRRIIRFVEINPDCFERSLEIGHITGSGWLIDSAGERVLLTHHKNLNKWLQLGGHADGNSDVLEVAIREAQEESGIHAIAPVSEDIFDVDVHRIPARGDEAAHDHYDVRFLLQVTGADTFTVSEESHELAWIHRDELPGLSLEESVLRMYRKWLRWS